MSRLHYRHRVRGSTYEEVGEATLQLSKPISLADGDTMRVYRSLDDVICRIEAALAEGINS